MKKFFDETFGLNLIEVKKKIDLPAFLTSNFSIGLYRIFEHEFVFIKYLFEEDFSIVDYSKRKKQIEDYFNIPCVLVFSKLNTNQKKGLIRNNYMFVLENKQIYMPIIGIILKNVKTDDIENKFTPIIQLCSIYIYNKIEEVHTIDSITKSLNINNMAASRSLKFLTKLDLLTVKKINRINYYKVKVTKRYYFNTLCNYLINPIKKLCKVPKNLYHMKLSGYSALSRNTCVLDNPYNTYATVDEYKNDDTLVEFDLIQVWKYDPNLLSNNDCIDFISLYAIFKNQNNDERTEEMLEKLKEKIIIE